MPVEHPPAILEIYRDWLKQGSEDAFRAVEEDAARICADLNCPHPHLAIESLVGPREVWWLNGFESEAHRQQVVDAYTRNGPLTAALAGISRRREGLVGTPVDIFVIHRPDLSRDAMWKLSGTRFFVVTVTRQHRVPAGAVFEAPDATLYVLSAAATSEEAETAAVEAGPETRVFAVRPYWGMPAREWIAADPDFWSANPMARSGTDWIS